MPAAKAHAQMDKGHGFERLTATLKYEIGWTVDDNPESLAVRLQRGNSTEVWAISSGDRQVFGLDQLIERMPFQVKAIVVDGGASSKLSSSRPVPSGGSDCSSCRRTRRS